MPRVDFQSSQSYYTILDREARASWLLSVIVEEGKMPGEVSVFLVSDEELLLINERFLEKTYYTDIITFPSEGRRIGGELYISLDRVKENAASEDVSMEYELDRVLVHGILHLVGYDDRSPEQKTKMKAREDFYLTLRR